MIEDLDSYNGVRVNGVLIEGTVNLNEGDVVQIGDYHLAITNNAEQTTLNIDRQGGGPGTDPMRRPQHGSRHGSRPPKPRR